MSEQLTIQTFVEGQWHDAFELTVENPARVRNCSSIYDLAPMVLDPEGVTRVTKWESERLGVPDWSAVCATFSGYIEPEQLLGRLKTAAQEFRALPGLLKDMPEEVRLASSIPLNSLDARLKEWGLL